MLYRQELTDTFGKIVKFTELVKVFLAKKLSLYYLYYFIQR